MCTHLLKVLQWDLRSTVSQVAFILFRARLMIILVLMLVGSAAGGSSVGFMITLALFFHKAPEAAGYGTFIVHMNCEMCSRIVYLLVSNFF